MFSFSVLSKPPEDLINTLYFLKIGIHSGAPRFHIPSCAFVDHFKRPNNNGIRITVILNTG